MKLKWTTLASGRSYFADTPLGMTLQIEKAFNGLWELSVGTLTFYPKRVKDANDAKHRTEKLYCTAIQNEYERLCK